jgi:hypothetical protein
MTIEASIQSASEPNSFVPSPVRSEWIIEGNPST